MRGSLLNSFDKRISKFENLGKLQKLIFGFFFVRFCFFSNEPVGNSISKLTEMNKLPHFIGY